MPARRLISHDSFPEPIRAAWLKLKDDLQIPGNFSTEVLAEVDQVVTSGYDRSLGHVDRTDLAFVTIDPPGSMDLDQAMLIERAGDGFTVWYAIADVAAWVRPGGAIDAETHRRGQTYYAPSLRTPLHPPALSERAASLLADGTPRPALVWTLGLDASGEVTSAGVERALVVSTARLNYADVQAEIDAGTAHPTMVLLKEVGELRQQLEAERGGVSLNLPDQEVVVNGDDWEPSFRVPLPNEGWNAQISLMTGYAAAKIMLDAGVGILRTLPPADPQVIQTLRTVAASLSLTWPDDVDYAGFVRLLDPTQPADHAMMMSCVRLFRGAGYTVITPDLRPDQTVHGALASSYAHCTAPLRRLVDRYVGEVCLALCAGVAVPDWVTAELPQLPEIMDESDKRAKSYERGITDLVEGLVLRNRVGDTFTGVVVQVDQKHSGRGILSVAEPAVEATVQGDHLTLGAQITARLASVDPQTFTVRFDA